MYTIVMCVILHCRFCTHNSAMSNEVMIVGACSNTRTLAPCRAQAGQEREVVHYILQRLRQLTAENETRFREYVRMLEVISTNRALEHVIEEEEKMLSQVDQTRLPSYRFGMQQGMQAGMQQEARLLLERLLSKRFGALSEATQMRLQNATLEQLNLWVDRILDAPTLSAVFDGH
jgi:hypothetical protein